MTVNPPIDNETSSLYRDAQDIEELAWWDIYQAAPDEYARDHQLRAERLPGGTCFAHKHLPSSLFNRVLKVGIEKTVTPLELGQLQRWLATYANPVHNIGMDPNSQPPEATDWLRSLGLEVTGGGIARFVHHGGEAAAVPRSELTVRDVGPYEQSLLGDVVRRAFGFPEGFDTWFGQLAGRADWRVYFACDGILPVGIGAMYVKDGRAWLGVGATLKEHRGRGAQRLLLNRRVCDASAMGVTNIHVETGHPLPGEPIGPSYRNISRAGFDVLFVRDQYMPKQAG
ncbi:hypothetical protein [Pseudomonas sp. B22129]|uniref:hypothetical protein n=1 Tax=Pseudomonas sp. B22129 TaxID=3235111 RepID=UPI0037841934